MIELKYKFKSIEQRGNELIAIYEIAMPEESEPMIEYNGHVFSLDKLPTKIKNQIAKGHYLKFLRDAGFGGYIVQGDEYLNYLDQGGK